MSWAVFNCRKVKKVCNSANSVDDDFDPLVLYDLTPQTCG